MKTSVTLQDMFSYESWPILILGLMILLYGGYLFVSFVIRKWRKKESKKQPKKQLAIPQIATEDKTKIKQKYIMQLENIKQELYREEITTRKAYEKMSLCIRHFVYEVTGIRVQIETLSEIKLLSMPGLEALMTEYYQGEFPSDSKGDGMEAIEKTKRAIELWN